MDTLLLSRIQFGFVISFHIIFPALSIGLASWLMFLEWRWLRTRDERIGISNGLWPASGLWKARLMHGWPADTGLDGLELTAATSSCRDSAWPLTDRSGLAGPWYQG